jgi:hypothetical protein
MPVLPRERHQQLADLRVTARDPQHVDPRADLD